MLPWWGWLIFWLVLVLGAAGLLGWLSWRVWGKVRQLTAELERAGAALAELEARVGELDEVDPPPTAVTQDPSRLREEHRRQRDAAAAERANRRAERLPPWARVH